MPTADATLLLPPPLTDADDTGNLRAVASPRHLDHVGVEAVLGAMIEQKRRASQPSLPAYREGMETEASLDAEDDDAPTSVRTGRAPTRSEVFLKAR